MGIIDDYTSNAKPDDKSAAPAAAVPTSGSSLINSYMGDSSVATGIGDKPKSNARDDIYTVMGNPSIASGVWQGLKDVPNTGAKLIGYIDSKLSNAGAKRNEDLENRLKAEQANIPEGNSAYDAGRLGGQVLGTGPLAAAVPEFAAVKAVPYAGRLAASALRGATGGGLFGAATNSANDEGLLSNVGTNAGYGAVAGPIAEGGVKAAGKAITGLKNVVEAVRVNNIVRNSGNNIAGTANIDPNAARNILARLVEAGHTPDSADAALKALGPNATIADLSPGLATETGALVGKTVKATDTLEGRFSERAAGANSVAHDLMESKLGVKPDLDAEKLAIHKAAYTATDADYKLAHASDQQLSVKPIVDSIDNRLNTAIGETKNNLAKVKSYFYDSEGNIKTDVKSMHEARQEIDANLSKLERDGESQSPAYRALDNVRKNLDAELKTNSGMASADAKFAQHMDVKEGLDIGYKAMDKGSFDKFKAAFDAATPEKQETIKKGLRIKIGDLMEKATRGELSEAQRLFGKTTNNRKMAQLAFGQDGDEVLAALEREANQRNVERTVYQNSHTARRLAAANRPEYGGAGIESGALSSIAQGVAADIVTGTPGGATAVTAGKAGYTKLRNMITERRVGKTIEGSADLLSRQEQHGRDTALDVLSRIDKVTGSSSTKLPVDYTGLKSAAGKLATPATIPTVKRLKSAVDDVRGVRN